MSDIDWGYNMHEIEKYLLQSLTNAEKRSYLNEQILKVSSLMINFQVGQPYLFTKDEYLSDLIRQFNKMQSPRERFEGDIKTLNFLYNNIPIEEPSSTKKTESSSAISPSNPTPNIRSLKDVLHNSENYNTIIDDLIQNEIIVKYGDTDTYIFKNQTKERIRFHALMIVLNQKGYFSNQLPPSLHSIAANEFNIMKQSLRSYDRRPPQDYNIEFEFIAKAKGKN